MKKINKKNQRKIYSNLQTLQVQPTSELCKRVVMDTKTVYRAGVQAHSGSECSRLIQQEVWDVKEK